LGTVWNGKSVFPSQEGKAGHPFRGEGSDRDRRLVRHRETAHLIYVLRTMEAKFLTVTEGD